MANTSSGKLLANLAAGNFEVDPQPVPDREELTPSLKQPAEHIQFPAIISKVSNGKFNCIEVTIQIPYIHRDKGLQMWDFLDRPALIDVRKVVPK